VRTLSILIAGTTEVIDARTSRVLISLVASMTAGAILLMSLESGTSHQRRELAGIRSSVRKSVIHEASGNTWSKIVVHSATGDTSLPAQCHFVISVSADSGKVRISSGENWKTQRRTSHILVSGHDYSDSIGICLMGDFSERSPDTEQFEALVVLVQELQRSCKISADHVYLRSDLDPRSSRPGKAFPVSLFNSRLINLKK